MSTTPVIVTVGGALGNGGGNLLHNLIRVISFCSIFPKMDSCLAEPDELTQAIWRRGPSLVEVPVFAGRGAIASILRESE
jgi:hypothetical protein